MLPQLIILSMTKKNELLQKIKLKWIVQENNVAANNFGAVQNYTVHQK